MKAVIWQEETLGAKFADEEIPNDMIDEANKYREKLVETVVELDDEIMEKYLDGTSPTEEQIKSLIRKGTIGSTFVPVLCGSAFKNKGVQPMLDAVVDFLPSPLDVPAIKGIKYQKEDEAITRKSSDTEPFSALAFKIMNDPFVGSLTFMRVYSGKIEAGSSVLNSVKDKMDESLALALIFFIGHILIAMTVVSIITGASIWEAGAVALDEPAVNSVWFYVLHKHWTKYAR